MEGAKDPDEYVLKYGSIRFNKLIDEAISLVEFKVKNLKKLFNIENPNEKIKFLNETAKILATVDNNFEKEIYIENISKEYKISKEAIYAEINKSQYSKGITAKVLEKPKIVKVQKPKEKNVNENTLKRENMIIALLINNPKKAYEKFKNKIFYNDIKDENNKEIIKVLYEQIEKGNINTNRVINLFENEEIINHITYVLAYDFEIVDIDKAIEDILNTYEKEKIIDEKMQILNMLENTSLPEDERKLLEYQLNEVIIKLVRMK